MPDNKKNAQRKKKRSTGNGQRGGPRTLFHKAKHVTRLKETIAKALSREMRTTVVGHYVQTVASPFKIDRGSQIPDAVTARTFTMKYKWDSTLVPVAGDFTAGGGYSGYPAQLAIMMYNNGANHSGKTLATMFADAAGNPDPAGWLDYNPTDNMTAAGFVGREGRTVGAGIKLMPLTQLNNQDFSYTRIRGGFVTDGAPHADFFQNRLHSQKDFKPSEGCTVRFDPTQCIADADNPGFAVSGGTEFVRNPIIIITAGFTEGVATPFTLLSILNSHLWTIHFTGVLHLEVAEEPQWPMEGSIPPLISNYRELVILLSRDRENEHGTNSRFPVVSKGQSFADFFTKARKFVEGVVGTGKTIIDHVDKGLKTVDQLAGIIAPMALATVV